MEVDCLVVGQGLSGTLLSYELMQQGRSVLILNDENPNAASRVASGVINPVTGRRMVRSWQYERFLPVALETYRQLERLLAVSLIRETSIIQHHIILADQDFFENRMKEEIEFLHLPSSDQAGQQWFNYKYEAGEIHPAWLIDVLSLLDGWKAYTIQHNSYRKEAFDAQQVIVSDAGIQYKDIEAKALFLCQGTGGFDNPYFERLPYSFNKGEALIATIEDLPRDRIFKHGISIVPWKTDQFWIGSTFDWKFQDAKPSQIFRQDTEETLRHWLKLPYQIDESLASLRPATVGQKPFVGFHPLYPSIAILNGMGSKGCTVAPFFARQLAKAFTNSSSIESEASIGRYQRVLSR